MSQHKIAIAGGWVHLEKEELEALLAAPNTNVWKAVRIVLDAFVAGDNDELKRRDTPLEGVRLLQGRIESIEELKQFIEVGLPMLYSEEQP